MAHLGAVFDANQVTPQAPFEVLPPDAYCVQIVRSEMRATKSGDGQYLELEMDVLDGPFLGRKLWDRLNLINRNPQATEIARRQLSAICHAIGVLEVSDSEQLHGRPFVAVVKVEERKDRPGEMSNRISGYKAINHQQGPATHMKTNNAPPEQQRTGSVPPWRRSP